MSFEPRDYLRHILVEADYLIGRSEGLSFEEFADRRQVGFTLTQEGANHV